MQGHWRSSPGMGVGEQPQARSPVGAWRGKEEERGSGGWTQAHGVCCISVSRPEVIIGCYSLVSETLWKGEFRGRGYSAAQRQFYFYGAAGGGDSKN